MEANREMDHRLEKKAAGAAVRPPDLLEDFVANKEHALVEQPDAMVERVLHARIPS
jgi:hypothetical protein